MTLLARGPDREAQAFQFVANVLAAIDDETEAPPEPVAPVASEDRSRNVLRPHTLDEIVGQERAKSLMHRVVQAARTRDQQLDHVLLNGPAGTGKTTFAQAIANEMGVDCFQVSAPIDFSTLLELRQSMQDGSVLFVDEIHLQASGDRRGSDVASGPELLLLLLEDQVIATPTGILDFPSFTLIGATTDPGRLPIPFIDRFPIQPRLEHYSDLDLAEIALHNARALGLTLTREAADMFARAAEVPRHVNRYVRNALVLSPHGEVDEGLAQEVIEDMNSTTLDGLTKEQQDLLTFMYRCCRREAKDGEIKYQSGVGNIATGIGLSRDDRAVKIQVEPPLIRRGLLQVGNGGRILTPEGARRAAELLEERT